MMNFYNLNRSELKDALVGFGFEGYRAVQLFNRIYKHDHIAFEHDKYLPDELKRLIQNDAISAKLAGKIVNEQVSAVDGTKKYLVELDSPKHRVESVVISENKRSTLCVSSQVGCSLACTFCHTGTQKMMKNLSTAEIISQYLLSRQNSPITNVVFMGQGEPLYNWRNVFRAIKILTDPEGISMGRSRITVSTSGIAPVIPKIAEELGVQLAVSLHSAFDKVRSQVMPINDTYDIATVLKACEEFLKFSPCSNRRITFEYVMLKDINDDVERDGTQLLNLLKHLPSHINLIPFNSWPGSKYTTSSRERIIEFDAFLNNRGLASTIRWPRGKDILAACGQLKSFSDKSSESSASVGDFSSSSSTKSQFIEEEDDNKCQTLPTYRL